MTPQVDRGFPGARVTAEKTSLLSPPPQCERPSPSPLTLTRREAEVLTLLAYRLTNAEIAVHLHISVRTAECHVERVLAKLQATNRREAAALAARRKMGS